MADEKKYMGEYLPILNGDMANKVASITNGFDEEDFAEHETPYRVSERRLEFKVTYVGVIYDQECFDNIVKPFQVWRQKWPEEFPAITFEYAGSSSRYFRNSPDLPFSYIDHGYVSHGDAIAIRANSDVQLFAQPSYFQPHFFSGKIFEMVRVGVPIVAVTHPSGAVAELIQKTGTGVVLRQNSFDENARILKDLYKKWRTGEALSQVDGSAVMEYSRENLAGQLAKILEAELGLSVVSARDVREPRSPCAASRD
jgi:glycosyltransferase involved in cell wall biosynthesis